MLTPSSPPRPVFGPVVPTDGDIRRFGSDEGRRSVLGAVNFGPGPGRVRSEAGSAVLEVPTGHGERFSETWTTSAEVVGGRCGRLVYGADGEHLFCATWLPAHDRYRDAVRELYREIFTACQVLGYPYLTRMWNLLGGINDDNPEGLEIYRDFCQGRSEAFERYGPVVGAMPVATGIGMSSPGLAVYLLSSREGRTVPVENSRQVPAYHYPEQYGPRPPSFARAGHVVGPTGERALLVAGTASIVGHRSCHPDDVTAQCEETFRNLAHLISAENLAPQGVHEDCRLEDFDQLKVYVRHPEHLSTVQRLCRSAFGSRVDIRYLIADVCRAELLVEIEGVVSLPAPA